ncbi:hypothetical protein GCM10009104_20250 [Marinobacterium maritimum]|uniref:Prepilin-type N-terminal cleavage/methylation domain-containing protein n=1 Tax=Marinobacterium maritimum TaxID=500162 RepID=A0ABP3TED2_9GAMM
MKRTHECSGIKSPSMQQGLSLVELMIGLVIGLVLLGGVMQTLLASKEASMTRRNMATITDDARFLYEFMSRDMRMVGRGYITASVPLSYAGKTLTSGYIVPNASGAEQTVEFSYSFADDAISYSRKVAGTQTVNGVLVDGVQGWQVSFGYLSGSNSITYTAYDSLPPDMGQVVAIRSKVTFADMGTGETAVNVASSPIVTTVALRNRLSDLFN